MKLIINRKRPEIPFFVFEATSACNLSCVYCYNHWKNPSHAHAPAHAGYPQARRTLARLFAQAKVGHVTFSGGEPFLLERFAELVLFVRLRRKTVSIISNGTVADRKTLEQLVGLGIEVFELPFHSADPRIHDQMTGVAGSHRRVVQSLAWLRELAARVVPSIVLCRHNADCLETTLSELAALGYRQVMLNRYNIGGSAASDPLSVLPDKEQLISAFRVADRIAKSKSLHISANVCTPHCILSPADFGHIRFTRCSDKTTERPLTVEATGNVRFCNHSPAVLGNLFHISIERILESIAQSAWNGQPTGICADCHLYPHCKAGCRAAGEQLSGIPSPDPILSLYGLC